MYRYIVNRLLLVVPTLVGAATLVFVLMRLIPGDICVVRLGSGGSTFDEAAVTACHAEIGIDRPWSGAVLRLHVGLWRISISASRCGRASRSSFEIMQRLPISLESRDPGDGHGAAAGDPARHDFGAEAEQLDRSRGPHLLDRRARHARFLARHRVDPDRARPDPGDFRPPLDAADRLRPDVAGPDPQSVDRDAAGAHDRLPLCRGVDADDALGDARSAARGLYPHRAGKRPDQPHRDQPARA